LEISEGRLLGFHRSILEIIEGAFN